MANPIQYTSRTFLTILSDINSDKTLADKPEWFKRMIAGVGDVLSMCLDAQANNTYLETAFTRDAVKKLCALIGYTLTEQTTSSGKLKFYLRDSTIFPVNVVAKDLCAIYGKVSSMRFESRSDTALDVTSQTVTGVGHSTYIDAQTDPIFETYDKVYVTGQLTGYYYLKVDSQKIYFATSPENIALERFVAVTTGTYTMQSYTLTAVCFQQEQKDTINVGNSDGTTQWQTFDLPDKDVLQDTLTVTINGEEWTRVADFSGSVATSKHYRLDYNNNRTSKIVFGDGTYGKIPENFPIFARYAVGGGSTTNITAPNAINIYAGGDENIEGVSNSSAFQGGSDPQSMTSAKILAPMSLKTRDRFVTVDDGLQLLYDSGYISIAYIWSNYYGSLSCKVNGVAKGGGNPSAEVKLQLQQYLKDRSVLGSIDVRFVDTVFETVDITVNVSLNTGYVLADVSPYVTQCVKLFFTECGKEIIDICESQGAERAIQLINQIFSTNWSAVDSQINMMLEYMTKIGYRRFGETIHESNLVAMISACVEGINHLTVSEIFPIELDQDSITTAGTVTVQEI